MTAYCTTIMIKHGPPGYCDVDYEYMYTDTPPLVDEQLAFIEKQSFVCAKYSYVRSIKTHTKACCKDLVRPLS